MPPSLSKVFNPRAFASGLVIAKAKRYAARIYEGFGPVRCRWMIAQGRPLSDFLTEETIAAVFEVTPQELQNLRQQFGWTSRAVTDKEFREEVLPLELQAIIQESGDKGEAWCASLIHWLRTEIGG